MNQQTLQQQSQFEELYLQIVEIWQKFCELHGHLYQLTCDEYSLFLASKIDEVEKVLEKKVATIQEIKNIELGRKDLIENLNRCVGPDKVISSVGDLVIMFQRYEDQKGQHYLQRYNDLLIDIIEKIQEQNKRNQLFVNKSLLSLKEIREGLMGVKSFNIYNSQGVTFPSGKNKG